MTRQKIPNTDLEVSGIIYGCMMIGGSWGAAPLDDAVRRKAVLSIRAAIDAGIDFFDTADIYCRGKSDEAFSGIWSEIAGLRSKIVLQTKAGIRFPDDPNKGDPARYDYSYEHLTRSVEGSLKRLATDYVDILLLHRPDALVEGEEVARALDDLHSSGKVRYFGVSNHSTDQIAYLRRFVKQPFVANQLEVNILHNGLINAGVSVNQSFPPDPIHGQGTLEYCRLNDIQIQAWTPLAKGRLSGTPSKNPTERELGAARVVGALAKKKGVPAEAILVAWLRRHPARIQPVIGTTRPERIAAACAGDGVELTREEWYSLFAAGRGAPMP
jgi:predicted oxidoreductase